MGSAVFNFKRCDNAPECPVITHCEEEMACAKGKAAVYYDEPTRKIVLNEDLCASHKCKSRICTSDCADCFSYAETAVEHWWEIEQIRMTELDPRYDKKDRFNSEMTSAFAKLQPDECYSYIQSQDGLAVLEITSNAGCCSAYDSIQILDILPSDVYYRYYRKTVLYTEDEIIKIESLFHINELPALLIFYNHEMIGKILGIYRNCEPYSISLLKKRVKEFLSSIDSIHILGEIAGV